MAIDKDAKRGAVWQKYAQYKREVASFVKALANVKSELGKMKVAAQADVDFTVADETDIQAFIDEITALKL